MVADAAAGDGVGDTRLYVVDASGNPVAEIGEDGSETSLDDPAGEGAPETPAVVEQPGSSQKGTTESVTHTFIGLSRGNNSPAPG